MGGRRLAVAAAVAAALVAAAWWLEFERPRRESERRKAEAVLLSRPEALETLTVERSGETHELRGRGDGSWELLSTELEHPEVADFRAVNLAADALASARLEVLAREAAAAGPLADFGLEPERLRLTWTADGRERRLALGDPVPPNGRRVYALEGGRLVTVDREVVVNTAWGSDHWRNKVVLEFPEDELRRIVLERPGLAGPGRSARVVLGRDEDEHGQAGAWRLLEPVDAPAHPLRVPTLLGWLQRLEADGFGPEEPTGEQLREAGLDLPTARVHLEMTDGSRHVLAFGRPRELTEAERRRAGDGEVLAPVHARLDEGGLLEVRPDLAEMVVSIDDALRDNRALPLPLPRLVGFRFHKELVSGEVVDLELSRELEGAWEAVKPAPARPSPDRTSSVLRALQGVQFGRFEDEIAADPTGFESTYDLTAPDTFTIEVRGLDLEGRPLGLLIEAGPPGAIIRDRDPFRPVRITDQADRRTVGIAKFRAFDTFLDRAVELHDSIRDAAGDEGP